MQQMFESITATEPGNVRAIELESFALNFRNDCSLHYEDKKLTITLRNFNQSVHDGYTTVSDVQQLLANVNALVANAAGVSLRKGQRKLQLADQAK
jgi:hypothetical protein